MRAEKLIGKVIGARLLYPELICVDGMKFWFIYFMVHIHWNMAIMFLTGPFEVSAKWRLG
jgi:hypothetical protein